MLQSDGNQILVRESVKGKREHAFKERILKKGGKVSARGREGILQKKISRCFG